MAWRIGVDIGGTFTDVALIDEASGAIGLAKVPTTPRDFAEGVLSALDLPMVFGRNVQFQVAKSTT